MQVKTCIALIWGRKKGALKECPACNGVEFALLAKKNCPLFKKFAPLNIDNIEPCGKLLSHRPDWLPSIMLWKLLWCHQHSAKKNWPAFLKGLFPPSFVPRVSSIFSYNAWSFWLLIIGASLLADVVLSIGAFAYADCLETVSGIWVVFVMLTLIGVLLCVADHCLSIHFI